MQRGRTSPVNHGVYDIALRDSSAEREDADARGSGEIAGDPAVGSGSGWRL